jgi:hypothetical protein
MGELLVSRDTVGDDIKGTAGDNRVIVTFTFTQSVEFDGAELVGLSDREIIERARELVASQYDGALVDGAHLLLGDADADLENMRGE